MSSRTKKTKKPAGKAKKEKIVTSIVVPEEPTSVLIDDLAEPVSTEQPIESAVVSPDPVELPNEEPAEPAEPAEPVKEEPVEPVELVEPVEPAESAEPAEQVEQADEEPAEPAEPTETTEPAEPSGDPFEGEDPRDIWLDTMHRSQNDEFDEPINERVSRNPPNKYAVVFQDTLTCAEKIVKTYNRQVAVLNFASPVKPGGCVDMGTGGQEEDIFRRTNISAVLGANAEYPLKENDLYYTSGVTVFKNRAGKDIKTPFQIDIISCAALQNPENEYRHGQRYYKNPAQRAAMVRKLHYICQELLTRGYADPGHYVVLGAWGCGSFGNPEMGLIEIFREILPLYQLNVVFAIRSPSFTKETDRLFQLFKRELQVIQ